MRQIDLESWPRREHFLYFNTWWYPHFSLCANVDVTAFYPAVKRLGVSFIVATVYVVARAANSVPEFRQRIQGEQVVEHDFVHPATTILTHEDFLLFASKATERIDCVEENAEVKDQVGVVDLLYTTSIPWVSVTSMMHPLKLNPVDSVPRIAWGTYFEENGALKMPLSVQRHHALMDGVHAGLYYEIIQDLFDRPQSVMGDAKNKLLFAG